MSTQQWLAAALIVLAAGLATNSVLGPLWFEAIEYRYSETILNQAFADIRNGAEAKTTLEKASTQLQTAWQKYK